MKFPKLSELRNETLETPEVLIKWQSFLKNISGPERETVAWILEHQERAMRSKKLDFEITSDGIVEARELDRVYCIFQKKGECDALVNGERLTSGNLYECLDACNQHACDILNRKESYE